MAQRVYFGTVRDGIFSNRYRSSKVDIGESVVDK